MEMVSSMNLCNSPSASVPLSPCRISFNHCAAQFYSVPTSPTGGLKSFPLVYSGVSSDLDDFEFETSMHGKQKHEPQKRQNLVPMAFADELFCNGQVLPLKPPPRLQYVNNSKCTNLSLSASSPSSPSSVLRGPFRRWKLHKSNTIDLDPFMVALENVTNEARGRNLNTPHRRTRSLSPLRSPAQWSNPNDPAEEVQDLNKAIGSQQPVRHVGLTPSEETEPNKPTLATPVSRKRPSRNRPMKPTLTTLPAPTVKTGEPPCKGDIKRDGSIHKGSKRFSIKGIMFRSASEGRADSEDDLKPHTGAVRRPLDLRNLSFKAIHKAHYNQQKDLAKLRKKTLIRYKAPCMLVCLGFGHNGLTDLN